MVKSIMSILSRWHCYRRLMMITTPFAGIDHSQFSALDRLGMRDGIEEISMIGGVIEVEEIRDAIL